ncbi:MAG: MAPEG family protein [Rhodospirillales bacterium]|nr:MAPEG family protein [Rhodospirillales bacterium]
MTVAIACVIVFLVLTHGLRVFAIRGAAAQFGRYDNNHPRRQQLQLEGAPARAQAAHQNGLEAFAPFAAAVLTAQIYSDLDLWRDGLAVAFVLIRIGYFLAYLKDWSTPRSLLWSAGFFVTIALFCLPLSG